MCSLGKARKQAKRVSELPTEERNIRTDTPKQPETVIQTLVCTSIT